MNDLFLEGKDPLGVLDDIEAEKKDDSLVTGRDNKNEDSNAEHEQ